eukprot:9477140-Pyramimonas_sp.AAC.1
MRKRKRKVKAATDSQEMRQALTPSTLRNDVCPSRTPLPNGPSVSGRAPPPECPPRLETQENKPSCCTNHRGRTRVAI